MNRISNTIQKSDKLLSVYFTAGFSNLNDTLPILRNLQKSGVDMVEIGLPFSDPLADGPVIQESSARAIKNGMTCELLFSQLKNVRDEIHIPLIIMGYFNPIMQFGVEEFCAKAKEIGIDGLIIPDLPVDIYETQFQHVFKKFDLFNIFLITPQTSEKRIRHIDSLSGGFIYMVSSASTTGVKSSFSSEENAYFLRIKNMNLKTPQLIGFGISNSETFFQATKHQKGSIIGSAFIKFITQNGIDNMDAFVREIKQTMPKKEVL